MPSLRAGIRTARIADSLVGHAGVACESWVEPRERWETVVTYPPDVPQHPWASTELFGGSQATATDAL